jgi:hypothetical protein
MTLTLPALRDEIVELCLEVDPGQVLRPDLERVASALDIDDPTRIAVEVAGRRALITIYPHNPLAQIRAVRREDLMMDRAGRIAVGRFHTGRVCRRRVHDPATGSAMRSAIFGTTGAGKSKCVHLELIAEKVNGFVSWLADLKEGQSVPEAAGHVDWRVTSQEGAILMLRAGVAVAEERMRRYSAAGRSAFLLNDPDPLLVITVDEGNRLLEDGAPYQDEATRLVREIGRTGRSVGVSIRLAAQAGHLEELGGSDTLRSMLKQGEVTLLRWSSNMMLQLVSDGLLPAGVKLMPIPRTLAPRTLASALDTDDEDEDEDGPTTAGMGYLLTGPHPGAMMRHWRIGSITPTPGLDPEILRLYGDEDPAELEPASHDAAGEAYAARHDPAALNALYAKVADGQGANAGAPAAAGGGASVPQALEDRITAALATADGPRSSSEILAAVNADGGREIAPGSVRNSLRDLVKNGDVDREGSLYALP